MKLPDIFEERMTGLLGDEYPAFRESMDQHPFSGLRINTLKISVERFLELVPFKLKPIPWIPEGFYYEESDRPTKHPYFHAGLYYIQEPSAMSPVILLDPQPGETILDACAAPGGKTCQIAARLQDEGLLLTNDISATRAKALLRNVEISGIKNAIILCEDPSKLIPRFAGKIDRILVDAPCSGEGMFRKSAGAVKSWDEFKQEEYHDLQKPLMEAAAILLAPGGRVVYSTCTFNRRENEDTITEFIKAHPDFQQDPGPFPGATLGFSSSDGEETIALYRLWPHKADGEGHFAARLKKGTEKEKSKPLSATRPEAPPEFDEFVSRYLSKWKGEGTYRQIGERLLLVPNHVFDFAGLRVIREGWYLGDIRKGRFEPSPALAMGLTSTEFSQCLDFQPDDPDLIRYIKGETLTVEAPKGWVLITVSGYPLGWAKGVSGFLKNHYPAAWRRVD